MPESPARRIASKTTLFLVVLLLTSAGAGELLGDGYSQGLHFFEENGGDQDYLGRVPMRYGWSCNLKKNCSSIPNDEARSMIVSADSGYLIKVYDSPDGKTNDDYARIWVESGVRSCLVPTFERSQSLCGGRVHVTYSGGNGLDGKVSRITVYDRSVRR